MNESTGWEPPICRSCGSREGIRKSASCWSCSIDLTSSPLPVASGPGAFPDESGAAGCNAWGAHRPYASGVSWNEPKRGPFRSANDQEWDRCRCSVGKGSEWASVAFYSGCRLFLPDGRGRSTLRLSSSLPDEATIREGIARFGWLIAELW